MNNIKNAKIAIIIGTRAELIKTFPVMLELQKSKIEYVFIHTGQHKLTDLCETFKVKLPDLILSKEPKKSSKFNAKTIKAIFWNLILLFKIKKIISKMPNLKYVLYHGDTMTTMTSAIASSKLLNPFKKYKNVHLEAGLRSKKLFEPFPEEISRIISDKFSNILISVSNKSTKNLKKEKLKGEIIEVGNTIVDSAAIAQKIAEDKKPQLLSDKKFALITIHRHENINNKERLTKIVDILGSLEIPSFFAIHDNTKYKLQKWNLYNKLISNKNIKLIEPQDYISFIYQFKRCALVICDGGSMQEESIIYNVPCVILRKYTERPEWEDTNYQYLSKLDVEKTKLKIKEYTDKDFKIKKIKNPYGEIGLSKKIVDALIKE